MSSLWSWGGMVVGTESEIIAGCLQGAQMLMKPLCLIIKHTNLREGGSNVVAGTPGHLKSLPLVLPRHFPPHPSPPRPPLPHLGSQLCPCLRHAAQEGKKTCWGNLTLAGGALQLQNAHLSGSGATLESTGGKDSSRQLVQEVNTCLPCCLKFTSFCIWAKSN